MARPRFHALVTAPLAYLAYRHWGIWGAIGATTGGILVDLDHLADYFWVRVRGQRNRFLAPLHAWELVAAGAALALWRRGRRLPRSRRSTPDGPDIPYAPGAPARRSGAVDALLEGLTAGLVLHLVQDVLTNRPSHAGVYALLYRLRHSFDRDRIGWKDHSAFHVWSGKPWYTWF